jgi:hypothetical protein
MAFHKSNMKGLFERLKPTAPGKSSLLIRLLTERCRTAAVGSAEVM